MDGVSFGEDKPGANGISNTRLFNGEAERNGAQAAAVARAASRDKSIQPNIQTTTTMEGKM